MIHYHFNCKLLTDVIISSSSATEGFHPSLDYIPGAKFWGIVAKSLYNNTIDEQTKSDLFHNGRVCFGDAHFAINGCRSHKNPLSWFQNKYKPEKWIYLHHFVDYDQIIQLGVQPKQMFDGYFTIEGRYAKPDQFFSIKSAYDSDKRRSEDEKMFGYYALPAGSLWKFSVTSDSRELLGKVKEVLEGKQRIGRSRSAQYGLGYISFEGESEQPERALSAGTHYLFADSAIIIPLEMDLTTALSQAEINYSKCKIRTRLYQSWNTTRNTRDADRQLIEKGSVIVVNLNREITDSDLTKNLKERRSEGFGDIIIDPDFLTNVRDTYFSTLNLTEWKNPVVSDYIDTGEKDTPLLQLLQNRKSKDGQVQNIDLAVYAFVTDEGNKKAFRSVTSSQWGTVRAFAHLFPDLAELNRQLLGDDLEGKRKGFLKSGIAKDKWGDSGIKIIEKILSEDNDNYPHPRSIFLEKVAAEMAKK